MKRYLFFLFLSLSIGQADSSSSKSSLQNENQSQADKKQSALFNPTIPQDVLSDVEHLLNLGYQKSGLKPQAWQFKINADASLKDSIHIVTDNTNVLNISIGNEGNAETCLYSFLDILGYRFYGPEDSWTYIPKLSQLISVDTTLSSYFLYRRLTPSYGVGPASIKELATTISQFNRWMNRLRMVNLINIPAGHYGSTFNSKYKKEIIAHPDWRGTDASGVIRPWSANLKLCYDNPGVVALYLQDAFNRLTAIKKTSAAPYILNMEPPDGGDFCTCKNCDNNVSNQVFGLANKISQNITSKSAGSYVSLYGYNEHAAVPSFKLNSNVIVGIVPYNYQGISSPEKMMTAWEAAGAKLYLRDYLDIPVSNLDKPSFSPFDNSALDKINHLKEKGYLGYAFETTASFMAVGLQFYLISQASWKTIDGTSEYQHFLSEMFPGYEDDVSVVYQNMESLNEFNFADALIKIDALRTKAQANKQSDIASRFSDIQFYIEYLYVLNQYQSNPSDADLNQLLDKIMSEPASRLLHPYGLYRVLQRTNKNLKSFSLTKNSRISPKSITGVQVPLAAEPRPQYKALNPDFYAAASDTFFPIPIRNKNGLVWIGDNHDGSLGLQTKAELLKSGVLGKGIITFYNMNGKYITELDIPGDGQWHNYEIKLPVNQFYQIRFSAPGVYLYLKGINRPFAFTEALSTQYLYQSVPFYFMIPGEQEKAVISIPAKSGQVVVKQGTTTLMTRKIDSTYTMEISHQEGKIIEIDMFRKGIRLINIPQLLSLDKRGIIVQSNQVPLSTTPSDL